MGSGAVEAHVRQDLSWESGAGISAHRMRASWRAYADSVVAAVPRSRNQPSRTAPTIRTTSSTRSGSPAPCWFVAAASRGGVRHGERSFSVWAPAHGSPTTCAGSMGPHCNGPAPGGPGQWLREQPGPVAWRAPPVSRALYRRDTGDHRASVGGRWRHRACPDWTSSSVHGGERQRDHADPHHQSQQPGHRPVPAGPAAVRAQHTAVQTVGPTLAVVREADASRIAHRPYGWP